MKYLCLILSIFSTVLISKLGAQSLQVRSIPVPETYERVKYPNGSFSNYLQNLPLKTENKVSSFKKQDLSHWYPIFAVIYKPLLFQDDLEQCADFTMRLWADFHKDTNQLDSLYLFNYAGTKFHFKESKLTYLKFLRKAFASSNSYSIKKGAKEISYKELIPGDLFVQNETGGIGHVSMILDHAKSKSQEDLYLIGFSFMPAQEMHIEKSPANRGKAGWFSYEGFLKHLTEYYPYGKPVLRRF